VVNQRSLYRLVARTSLLFAPLVAGCNSEPPALSASGSQVPTVVSLPDASQISNTPIEQLFSLPDPSPSDPVVVGMRFDPAFGGAGDAALLLVSVRIARAHHVYALGDADSTFSPVRINVQFPDELQPQGDWNFPEPEVDKGGRRVYRNALLVQRTVKVAAGAFASSLTVNGQLSFQVCTDELCWPRRSIEVSTSFIVHPAGGRP
jgi:hypothetical protein